MTSPLCDIIEQVNDSGAEVLSIDVPSGLNADTGHIANIAIEADVTITFIGMKQGLLTGAGPDVCGEIIYNDLSLEEAIFNNTPASAFHITITDIEDHLLPRMRTAHKGNFGHVLIIGGDHGMPGAVRMAGEAAARVGAGLVTIATRSAHIPAIVANRPELMCHGIEQASDLANLFNKTTA